MKQNKRQFAVTFGRRNSDKTATFFRWEISEAAAVEAAADGFQWAYGYYPDTPTDIKEITPE